MRRALAIASTTLAAAALGLECCTHWVERQYGSAQVARADDAGVRAERMRIEGLAAQQSWLGPGAACSARILTTTGQRTTAWVSCTGGPQRSSGSSGPVLVEGGHVAVPRDGAAYADDLSAWFPWGLRALVAQRDPAVTTDRPA